MTECSRRSSPRGCSTTSTRTTYKGRVPRPFCSCFFFRRIRGFLRCSFTVAGPYRRYSAAMFKNACGQHVSQPVDVILPHRILYSRPNFIGCKWKRFQAYPMVNETTHLLILIPRVFNLLCTVLPSLRFTVTCKIRARLILCPPLFRKNIGKKPLESVVCLVVHLCTPDS